MSSLSTANNLAIVNHHHDATKKKKKDCSPTVPPKLIPHQQPKLIAPIVVSIVRYILYHVQKISYRKGILLVFTNRLTYRCVSYESYCISELYISYDT